MVRIVEHFFSNPLFWSYSLIWSYNNMRNPSNLISEPKQVYFWIWKELVQKFRIWQEKFQKNFYKYFLSPNEMKLAPDVNSGYLHCIRSRNQEKTNEKALFWIFFCLSLETPYLGGRGSELKILHLIPFYCIKNFILKA